MSGTPFSCTLVMMQRKQKVLIIVGPTASGKSALAVEMARKYNGEIISADSRQVYKGLDIGTGKITKRDMKSVPHHLLDVASPKNTFTAHDFIGRAQHAIEDISARARLPIVAGGTGFYIDALVGRIALPNASINPALRSRLEKKTTEQLFALLKRRDPRRAKTIEQHHKRRLIRALEIVTALGHVPKNTDLRSPYFDSLWIGLSTPQNKLKEKITVRLFARISRGMVAEAKRLHAGGLSYKRMETLGLEYRSLARFLQRKTARAQMTEEMRRGSFLYAKRQMRYWKRNRSIKWFNPSQTQKMSGLVRAWLKK